MPGTPRPYGLWDSPLTPRAVALGRRLADVQIAPGGDTVVWLEGRSDRGVLVAAHLPTDGAPRDLTSDLNVRAKVGYGGGDFTLTREHVFFVADDARLYRQPLTGGGVAKPITPAIGLAAAPAVSPDGRWVVYVTQFEQTDGLAVVPADGSAWPQRLVAESDFVMQPRWHPDGTRLAWVAWDHPNMPWDGTRLRLAQFADGHLSGAETIAGGADESVFQPEFTPDGRALVFCTDRDTGFWNLYLLDLQSRAERVLTAERFEVGEPAWAQGQRVFGLTADGRVIFVRNEGGFRPAYDVPTTGGAVTPIEGALGAYAVLTQPAVEPTTGRLAALASGPRTPPRVVLAEPTTGEARVLAHSGTETIPARVLSAPAPITWTGHDGGTAHGLYYAPQNDAFTSTGAPPLIVRVHGGPTSQVKPIYAADIQFFTSRGFAVLDVNYRGSTGYGRKYRNALRGAWGIFDVEDSRTGALSLAERGLADPERLAILGGSAGGFTVLQSLVVHPGVYRAGVCLFGVSNQFTLAADTHKFEARYLDTLLGPLPQAAAVYRERSPEFHAERIVDPLILFQGADDLVVPRAQADSIAASLARRNIRHAYHVYEGEGHGWRKTETIEHYLTHTLAFLKTQLLYA